MVVCLLYIKEERDEEEEREKDRDDDAICDEYFIVMFILFYCIESSNRSIAAGCFVK